MARDATWKLLGDDPVLNADYGIDRSRVLPNYGFEDVPNSGFFLVLRWEEVTRRSRVGFVQVLTVWAHRKRTESFNYLPLQQILKRTRKLLVNATDVPGEDGTLHSARFTGSGRDLFDSGFDTLTINSAFEISAGLTEMDEG